MWFLMGHAALLLAAVAALSAASLRLAALAAPAGLDRALAAAPVGAAAAVACALGLGLVGLGTSPLPLGAAAIALWLAARALPAPARSVREDLAGWWTARSPAARAAAGALAGLVVVYAVWLTRYPYLGTDGLAYHLPDVLAWLQDGRPGSRNVVLPLIPVESYPVTYEVLLTWAMGIARSFAPIAPLQLALMVLLGASVRTGLAALCVPPAATWLAAGAVVSVPILVGELNGPLTDLPTVAWLACAAALGARSLERPALLAPALLAAGLAVGTRTTAAPGALVALGLAGWAVHRRHGLPLRPLALAAAGAVAVGGAWYLRNLLDHGSPLWPLVAAPWGDPQPAFLDRFDVRFLQVPGDTLSAHFDDYRVQLAGSLALIAGALVAPLAARRREALAAGGIALALVLAWSAAPYTGVADRPVFSELAVSTIRYLMPAVLACTVAVAIAARAPGWGRRAALAVLAAALAWNLVEDVRAGFPFVPSPATLTAALAAGALTALALGRLTARGPGTAGWALTGLALAALAAAGLAVGGDGYVRRHVETGFADAGIAGWFATRPGYATDERPVAQAPVVDALLAGDRLRHPVPLIRPDEPCARVRRRAREGWVVVGESPFDDYAAIARRVEACLGGLSPVYEDSRYRVYGPDR